MKRLLATLALTLAVTACGGGVGQLAKDTCDALEGQIMLTAAATLSRAIGTAEEMGSSGAELGTAMRKECPSIMAQLDDFSSDQNAQDALPGQMTVDVTQCSRSGSEGTVKNGSSVTVDVFLSIQYIDEAGVVIDDGLASVQGLRAGETGRWDSSRIDETTYDKCRADVDSAYAQ